MCCEGVELNPQSADMLYGVFGNALAGVFITSCQ
jgi:hypothetical protein